MQTQPTNAPLVKTIVESKLLSLKPHFLHLSPEAQLNLILAIRANRRIPKRVDGTAVSTKPRRAATKKPVTKASAQKLISSLSAADIAALLEEFGGDQ